jgi:hypothetical protein
MNENGDNETNIKYYHMHSAPIKLVDVFVYVKKQLKLIFDIPRFTIAYGNMTVLFSQVHSIDLVDHYS